MKKRILSVLLVLVMALGMFPMAAVAEDSITVYVTVSNQGVLAADKNGEAMGHRAVTVTDRDGDGRLTIFDAYDAAHEQLCTSEFLLNGAGLVGQLWGDHSGAFLTYVNNAGISGDPLKTQTIADGDHLLGAILSDTSYWSDYYSFFDTTAKQVQKDEAFTLTLKGRTGMSWSDTPDPDSALKNVSVGTWTNGGFSAIDGKTTDKNGEVTLSFGTAGTYYVTAAGSVASAGSITGAAPIIAPICVVTVTEEKTDEALIADDKAALNISYTPGQALSLPNRGASGKTAVAWSFDPPGVISDNGAITQPEQDTSVTATATITCNGKSDTKEFTVVIPGRLNGAKATLAAAVLKPVEFTNPTDGGYQYSSAQKDSNILDVARAALNDSEITLTFADSFVPDALIAADGVITYPTDEAKEIVLPIKLSYNGQSTQADVTAVIPKHARTKAEEIASVKQALVGYMTDPKVLNGNASLDEVKTALLLPGGKSSGLYIKWTSNNTSVIDKQTSYSKIVSSANHPTGGYYTAPVMRPGAEDAVITLTAELTYRSTSVDLAAGPLPPAADRKITFSVKVPALTEAERQAIVNGAANDVKIFDKDGAAADITNITSNLYFPKYDGFQTKWTTDIAGITIPSSGYGKAAVSRPEKGADDLVGTITVTITAGNIEESKTFDAKVPAWTQEDLDAARSRLDQVAQALTFDAVKGENSSAGSVQSNLFLKRFASFADGEISLEHMTKNDENVWPVAITWEITPGDGPITYNDRQANKGTGIVTTPEQDTEVSLKATINYRTAIPGVNAVEKTITVTVVSEETTAHLELMDNIAARYVDSSNEWEVMEMGAYASMFPAAGSKTSDDARQVLINNTVNMLTTGKNSYGSDAGAGDYAKAILALTAVGVDPAQLYAVNSNTTLSVIEALDPVACAATSPWTAPYVLQAYHHSSGQSSTHEDTLVGALLDAQQDDGSWNEFGTIDTTANVIAALSLYKTIPEVQDAIDKAVEFLSNAQLPDGTFDDGQSGDWAAGSNANSTAMVIIALAANGIDPNTDARFVKSGKSLLYHFTDAFALVDNDGFGYTDFMDYNAMATEQGFRALLAAYGVMSTGTAYNVYAVNGNDLVPGRATGTGSVISPSAPSGDSITVTLSIKSDTDYWLRSKTVTVPGTDATVYHAFIKAIEGSGITQVGAENGYVKSITKNATTLTEFGKGKNSGWMYKLNGELPKVGLTECKIKNGDEIVWFYTKDWTSVPGASFLIPDDVDRENNEEETSVRFADVSQGDYFYEAVKWAVEKGITAGTSATTFSPDDSCTRAQMVTFLWNAAGKPKAKETSCAFTDVDQDAYYYQAVLWAVESGITAGTSATTFSPEESCTRGQMAMFLYHSAKKPAVAEQQPFADVDDGAYYSSAVVWAKTEGITAGTSATTFGPEENCTRAQMVTFLYRFMEE